MNERRVVIPEAEFKRGNALTEVLHEIEEARKEGVEKLVLVAFKKYQKPSFDCNAKLYLDAAVKANKIKEYVIEYL